MVNQKTIRYGIVACTLLIMLIISVTQVTYRNPTALNNPFDQFSLAQDGLPRYRGDPAMAYDNESDTVVIFGGWKANLPFELNDTWLYFVDNDSYSEVTPSSSPSNRSLSTMVYDSLRDRMVLFGGIDDYSNFESELNDTWIYDTNANNWTEVFPATSPPATAAHAMAYDSESDKVVLFGGWPHLGTDLYPVDTWVYSPGTNEWQVMSPALSPSPRALHVMAYDEDSDRIILHGGEYYVPGARTFRSDTWAYDLNTDTWEELTISTHPSGRAAHGMVYDSESDRMVMFGGADLSTDFGDTWLFDYNASSWELMNPSTSPSARFRIGAAYDGESDRVIIFGGVEGAMTTGQLVNEDVTWAYDANSDSWEQMTAFPPYPTPTTTTTTTTTTSDPTTTPTGGDMTLIYIAVAGVGVVLILVVFFVRRR